MQVNRRTAQRGSVATFLVVAAVLAAIVIGGAFALQQRSAQVRTGESIAQQSDESSEGAGSDTTQQQSSDEQAQQKADEEAKKQAEAKQAEEQKAAAEKQAAEQKAAEAQKQQADAAATAAAEAEKKRQQEQVAAQAAIPQTGVTPSTAGSLPQTGPSETIAQLIGVTILLGVVLAYLKSYRHRFGSILK